MIYYRIAYKLLIDSNVHRIRAALASINRNIFVNCLVTAFHSSGFLIFPRTDFLVKTYSYQQRVMFGTLRVFSPSPESSWILQTTEITRDHVKSIPVDAITHTKFDDLLYTIFLIPEQGSWWTIFFDLIEKPRVFRYNILSVEF